MKTVSFIHLLQRRIIVPAPGGRHGATWVLKLDTEFFTGKKAGRVNAGTPEAPPQTSGPQPTTASTGPAPQGAAAYPDDVEVFPVQVTKETVHRGKERYEIFCSACHGLTGNGDGMIVRRGFRRAASFNDQRLMQAPVATSLMRSQMAGARCPATHRKSRHRIGGPSSPTSGRCN